MIIGKIAEATFVLAVSFALTAAAAAQDRGTLDLAPGAAIARTMTDQEMSTQRGGGWMGIAFSADFTAVVTNATGTVTGTGTSGTTTSGVTSTNPPVSFNVEGAQVQLSTFVGNLGNLNGAFNFTIVNGFGNVVDSRLNLNIALVNVANGATIPTLSSIFK